MSGKGDKRRPSAVNEETLAERWEKTFGRKPPREGSDKPKENNATHTQRPTGQS